MKNKATGKESVIKVAEGKLKGKEFKTVDGTKYTKYSGIPYAEPPIGNLRFKRPRRKESWPGVWEGKDGVKCLQASEFLVEGDEDCLYLNVWVPKTKTKEALPVMVWLHGGFFLFGAGDAQFQSFGKLLQQNVIVVSINYRLGVLGFFSMGNYQFSGNLGIRDQRLALQWIKKNIINFGGDPQRVTLFGQGSGAVSTHLHLISAGSRGLFSAAILQSGSLLTKPNYDDTTLDVINSSNRLADLFDCGMDVEGCLQSLPADILMQMSVSRYQFLFHLINCSAAAIF